MATDLADKRLTRGCAILAIVTAVVAVVGFQVIQSRITGPPVTFVLPNDYRGPFFLVLDPKAPAVETIDNKITLTIPPNGILKIKSFAPMERIHRVFARDASNREIKVGGGDNYPGIALNAVEVETTRQYTLWFVGPYPDLLRLRDNLPKPPIATTPSPSP